MGVVVARQVTGYRESRPASPTAASAASGHAALPTRRHPAKHAVDGRAHGVVINGCGHQRGHGEQAPNKHRDEHHAGFGGSRDDPFDGLLAARAHR